MDGGRTATAADLRRLEGKVDSLRDVVNQQGTRLAVLESTAAKNEETAKTKLPSKSEFLAAATAVHAPRKEEPNAALETLKVVAPWIVALLSLVAALVHRLID